jgi:SAM-dependent methyltransferase
MSLRSVVKSLPVIGPLAKAAARPFKRRRFDGSADYWERRYIDGGNSGAGSYNRLAEFKAAFLNDFVARNGLRSVIEFGSGDGAQLELAQYPEYIGVDVSKAAVETTRSRFASDPSKRFFESAELPPATRAELSLSLDVIYHLVEDVVFDGYMRALFDASTRFVIVYSSNDDRPSPAPHVRHRRFTDWVQQHRPEFALKECVANSYPFDANDPDNTSFADFYVFERTQPR